MDHFSYLIDSRHRFLLVGMVLLILSSAFVLTGESFERRRIVYRTEEPKRFWWNVVSVFLLGLFLIGCQLFQNSK
jgi:predicted cation transporter